MRVLLVERDRNADPQVLGSIEWKAGRLVTAPVDGPLNRFLKELDGTSEESCRRSMERLARKYDGSMMWFHFDP